MLDSSKDETGRMAVMTNLVPTPLLSAITASDFVAFTPKIILKEACRS